MTFLFKVLLLVGAVAILFRSQALLWLAVAVGVAALAAVVFVGGWGYFRRGARYDRDPW